MSERFAVIDVETSGLSARWHRVLQIAVVTTDGSGNIQRRWSSYIRRRYLPVGPTAIHGLTRAKLRNAPRFADVVSELVGELDGAILVAHNVRFDWAFLRRSMLRAGYRPPDVRRFCTLELSRSLDPDRALRHRLGDLCERYQVPLDNAHDALADASATAAVLPHLLTALGGSIDTHSSGDATTWAQPNRPPGLFRRLW